MAYVPGYQHDVFISYAHGDDRGWIATFASRLEAALKQRLVGVAPAVWIDADDLRKSRDFNAEISASVKSSAVFLLLTSPSYIGSSYCVDRECPTFAQTLPGRRQRFTAIEFANEKFTFRCPILPTDNNLHWSLFEGLSDFKFCDAEETLAVGSAGFEASFRSLTGELVGLLKRMRNHSNAVFLHPTDAAPDLAAARDALAAELAAHSYRILPDHKVNLASQLRDASLSVFLLGADYDERAAELVEVAAEAGKPWVAWCSPSLERRANADQMGFGAHVEQLDSAGKTYLHAGVTPVKLKEEVLALLGPGTKTLAEVRDKPRVYLVYNARDQVERKNAGLISYHFRKEIHFEHPDDPAQHTARLTGSDGVLLVWGSAGEDWCSREFEMVQVSRPSGANGLCLFDPADTKSEAVRAIRGVSHLFVGEQFGKFDPARLTPFFAPLLRHSTQLP